MSAVEPAVVPPVGLDEVRAARELLDGVVSPTPVAGSRALTELCGGPVWLKCENLQRTAGIDDHGPPVIDPPVDGDALTDLLRGRRHTPAAHGLGRPG